MKNLTIQSFPPPPHPSLSEILAGETSSKSGYSIISEAAFNCFLRDVPHLFRPGLRLLGWLFEVRRLIESNPYPRGEEEASILRAVDVLQTVTRTANLTAPTDLWLLNHVLATHRELGTLDWMLGKREFSLSEIAGAVALQADYLRFDLELLYARGYLDLNGDCYRLSPLPQVRDVLTRAGRLPPTWDAVGLFVKAFSEGASTASREAEKFLELPVDDSAREGWVATPLEIELGYRLVPMVLAVRKLGLNEQLTRGKRLSEVLPHRPLGVEDFLKIAGMLTDGGEVSVLGERIISRAPGPFGIIYAYLPYLQNHVKLLRGEREAVWVKRGENVAASRDANAKTFTLINDSLDRYCQDHGFTYSVFIEHAVGYGEATRQRFERAGEENIQYFGADLEDAAIDRAVEAQKKGDLPKNMKFIRRADIGDPPKLIQAVVNAGFPTAGAVMVVGNGFHEIRKQTNEKMIEVFRAYCAAGILLIFTEESALTSDDLRATAWNTYHAGFRYTHAISGQELRPVDEVGSDGRPNPIYTWEKCLTAAGYQMLKRYSTRTRTIYPHPRPDGRNPAISVNYFCVPPNILRFARHAGPTGDIEEILSQIERGREGTSAA
jgi:hypothetical protein